MKQIDSLLLQFVQFMTGSLVYVLMTLIMLITMNHVTQSVVPAAHKINLRGEEIINTIGKKESTLMFLLSSFFHCNILDSLNCSSL